MDFVFRDRRMVILITIVHVVVCLFLAVVVLLQSGKAADLAGAFGGMGSQTVFGPRGSATVLSKATTIAAALFMLTSLTPGNHEARVYALHESGGGTRQTLQQLGDPIRFTTDTTGNNIDLSKTPTPHR